MAVRFLVADTLTGKVLGDLEPTSWELSDPLRTAAVGSMTLALDDDAALRARMVDLTQPRIRQVAAIDGDGRFLWGGPIPARPSRSGAQVTVPLMDWRGWFNRAPIRPNPNGTRRNYIKGGGGLEQTQIMTDLAKLALDTKGAPRMVVDSAPVTGIKREITALMLDRSIGEHLTSMQELDSGCEWWTYITWDGDETSNRILPHFAVAWPERFQRPQPVRLEYRIGQGGSAHDYSWPQGQDTPTRVWAVGDGQPPDQVYTSDQYPGVTDGTEVAWESIIGPLAGVGKKRAAFDAAYAELQRSRGNSGEAEFSVLDESIPFGEIVTGDRARIVLSDGWVDVDVPAARIVSRTLSGGKGQPFLQRLTLDLADDGYPDDGTTPGRAGHDLG